MFVFFCAFFCFLSLTCKSRNVDSSDKTSRASSVVNPGQPEKPISSHPQYGSSLTEWLTAAHYDFSLNCARLVKYQSEEEFLFLDGNPCIPLDSVVLNAGYLSASETESVVFLRYREVVVGEAWGLNDVEGHLTIKRLCTDKYESVCKLIIKDGKFAGFRLLIKGNSGNSDETTHAIIDNSPERYIESTQGFNLKLDSPLQLKLEAQGLKLAENCLHTIVDSAAVTAYLSGQPCLPDPTVKFSVKFDATEGKTLIRRGEVAVGRYDDRWIANLCTGDFKDICTVRIEQGRFAGLELQ